ncbi:MAG: hypothetical protein CND58_03365 [Rhodothermaeota bacterium MED-G16]|nr:MAG: hypothetical protein CND58_03365 [Rhodothermaeota bacterium MED-G16]
MDFTPNLSPKEIIRLGSFGGIYFYDEGGRIDINYKEFPSDWFEGLEESFYLSKKYNRKINFFKIKSGLSQEEWEEKGWINKQDPRGWFQWYCRYYMGRRTDDDERQIKRWNNFCGEKGRWRNYIYSKINKRGTSIDDISFSLAVRQSLLHWGYMINNGDFDMWKEHNSF